MLMSVGINKYHDKCQINICFKSKVEEAWQLLLVENYYLWSERDKYFRNWEVEHVKKKYD